ncbi:MAG: cell division protein FtsL [Alphaproteobacteria bacterium]
MINFFNILVFCFVVVVGGGLFHIKYKVIDLETRLKNVHQKTVATKESIKVLHAEWGYLNNPGRLQQLAQKYLHILPPDKQQVAAVGDLNVVQARYAQTISQSSSGEE